MMGILFGIKGEHKIYAVWPDVERRRNDGTEENDSVEKEQKSGGGG